MQASWGCYLLLVGAIGGAGQECAPTAIPSSECPADPDLPACDTVACGELCDGDGECGTNTVLNNCGGYDVYRREPCATTTSTTSTTTTTSTTSTTVTCSAGHEASGHGCAPCPEGSASDAGQNTCLPMLAFALQRMASPTLNVSKDLYGLVHLSLKIPAAPTVYENVSLSIHADVAPRAGDLTPWSACSALWTPGNGSELQATIHYDELTGPCELNATQLADDIQWSGFVGVFVVGRGTVHVNGTIFKRVTFPVNVYFDREVAAVYSPIGLVTPIVTPVGSFDLGGFGSAIRLYKSASYQSEKHIAQYETSDIVYAEHFLVEDVDSFKLQLTAVWLSDSADPTDLNVPWQNLTTTVDDVGHGWARFHFKARACPRGEACFLQCMSQLTHHSTRNLRNLATKVSPPPNVFVLQTRVVAIYERSQPGVGAGAETVQLSAWVIVTGVCVLVIACALSFCVIKFKLCNARRPSTHPIYDPCPAHVLGAVRAKPSKTVPSYWVSSSDLSHDPPFYSEHESGFVKELAQKLMASTHNSRFTSDRRTAPMPKTYHVMSAFRVENSALWQRYIEQRGRLRRELEPTTACTRVETTQYMPAGMVDLDDTIGEVYLFHGTDKTGAKGIARDGFQIDLAGTATGMGFGKGAYFAERSTKADEYAASVDLGLDGDVCTMLLCRVSLGRMKRITEFDVAAERHVLSSSGRYHSLLGDREAAAGTFREFVVYNPAQVYPEYKIIYQRVY